MHALGGSVFGTQRMTVLAFYGEWTKRDSNDKEDDNADDDNVSLKGRPKENKKKKAKKHWRMLKRRYDFINTQTRQMIADISDFIDFAIIGNPKTGTTFFADWLNRHRDLYLPAMEMRHLLEPDGPALLVEQFMHKYRRKKGSIQLGYKCPADIRQTQALTHLRDYFPKTKLIVGLRHPILWFQSFCMFHPM